MNDRIDVLLSNWLDDENENPAGNSDVPAGEANESIAESLLIHGMLANIGSGDDAAGNRIGALMLRLDAEFA